MPNVGDTAPDFSLTANDGKTYSLSQFRGKRHVVLVFYPGDDTPTCTAQLCDYRDGWSEFQELDAVILGVSTNDLAAHQKFAEKFAFPFPLLEDPERQLCKAYGVLMLGGLLPVANRAVFIIDKQGVIRYRHVETIPIFKRSRGELLDALRKLAD
ncbi:MAG: peroxiredoxin [Chloracidobacterium sp.]|uniref:thioredoxin-dependent peroxiredoxin n=1 Tax=Chloracidobacterium validum TaxID=2821543 RepID=A0ABX8BCB4_9BACT|nr:peroxiredoxin [Chloracidobacterium validum]QUW03430.1 peroxiredoxin [Chloracidobacterium validum]